MGEPFRIQPAGPAAAYRTFTIKTPRGPETTRPATCEEVTCDAWLNGWVTKVPNTDEWLNKVRAAGRTFIGSDQVNGEWVFTFPPGTPCFRASQHTVPIRPDLPQAFVVRGGDWRGNPTGEIRRHTRPEDWAEHLQEHTGQLADRIERG